MQIDETGSRTKSAGDHYGALIHCLGHLLTNQPGKGQVYRVGSFGIPDIWWGQTNVLDAVYSYTGNNNHSLLLICSR